LSSTLTKSDIKADAQAILARGHCRRNVFLLIKDGIAKRLSWRLWLSSYKIIIK